MEGTHEDWEKILEKTRLLRNYELEWWIDEIEPVLIELVETSKGNVNKEFWRNIFKFHKSFDCSHPDYVDGWIVKLLPYYEKGERTNLEKINTYKTLADAILKVNVKYVLYDWEKNITIPLEGWRGFIGLRQAPVTFALKPE